MKTSINFETTRQEAELIREIAAQAVHLATDYGVDYDFMNADMDITACHCNGMPLDLERLKDWGDTKDPSFGHDVFGIRRHINRDNGQIENCFVPRCFKPSSL